MAGELKAKRLDMENLYKQLLGVQIESVSNEIPPTRCQQSVVKLKV